MSQIDQALDDIILQQIHPLASRLERLANAVHGSLPIVDQNAS